MSGRIEWRDPEIRRRLGQVAGDVAAAGLEVERLARRVAELEGELASVALLVEVGELVPAGPLRRRIRDLEVQLRAGREGAAGVSGHQRGETRRPGSTPVPAAILSGEP